MWRQRDTHAYHPYRCPIPIVLGVILIVISKFWLRVEWYDLTICILYLTRNKLDLLALDLCYNILSAFFWPMYPVRVINVRDKFVEFPENMVVMTLVAMVLVAMVLLRIKPLIWASCIVNTHHFFLKLRTWPSVYHILPEVNKTFSFRHFYNIFSAFFWLIYPVMLIIVRTSCIVNTSFSCSSGLDHLYTISYQYFSAIGTVMVIIVGLIVSFITGEFIVKSQNLEFLFSSHFCQFWLICD